MYVYNILPMYPDNITSFLPYLSLHGPSNRVRNAGKKLSINDLLITIKVTCGCTCKLILSASVLLLFLCSIIHSVSFIPNVMLQVRDTIRSVRIVPVEQNIRYKVHIKYIVVIGFQLLPDIDCANINIIIDGCTNI